MPKQTFDVSDLSNLAVFDTAVGSENLGDQIIMDAVERELHALFPRARLSHFPTHQELSSSTLKKSKQNDLGILGGTNIIRNRWYRRARKNQWRVSPQQFSILPDIVTLGVGCNNYQDNPSGYTRRCYQKLLNNGALHSVRDNYTLEYLQEAGVKNVINTACPTFWTLTSQHCSQLPTAKAKEVVFTLTDYRQDLEADKLMLQQLMDSYDHLHFWPQGPGDEGYLQQILNPHQHQKLSILAPRLDAYDELLDSDASVDFVGTRLHAGCRAMQKGRRALIIGVDNRAKEKQTNFNIPVLERQHIGQLQQKLASDIEIRINLPEQEIARWKQQFL